jgi:hypothetical protein
MAQLTTLEQTRIDHDLDHALREWGRLPDVEAVIDAWPEDEMLTFVQEWTLEEDRLRRLASHAARDELTSDQQIRFRDLLALVGRHRPIVDRLIEG